MYGSKDNNQAERLHNGSRCKKMGITRVTLAQNLSRNPTVGTLQKIADVIGCKVGDFFIDDMDIKENENTIICPHCGKKIKIEKEE